MINANECNQCGECCKLFFINLDENEYKSGKFETIFNDISSIEDFSDAVACGANFLAKNEDGDCIYLENNSCSIHTRRPQVCREFFCNSKTDKYAGMRSIIDENRTE